MSTYPHLLSPLQVGTHTLRNRVEAAPTIFVSLVQLPHLRERAMRMVEDRARGGAAMVVTGEITVNFTDSMRPVVDDGRLIELPVDYLDVDTEHARTFGEMATRIKRHGALAIAELSHLGQEKPLLADGHHPVGPVTYVRKDGVRVAGLDDAGMARICREFADAAEYFKAVGFDGVMIHHGHGWLAGQFFNPRVNTRTDRYGGSAENRARFPREILEAVRERCGADLLVEVRVSGRENIPGGITVEENIEVCRSLDGHGLVDLFHVSAGHYYSPSRSREFSTVFTPNGLNADAAAVLKAAVSVPVNVVGGITTPELADRIIAEGQADMVALGRQMIADPDWVRKAQAGERDRIRQCIRCTVCYPGPSGEHETDPADRVYAKLGSCTVNPYSVNVFSHHTVFPDDLPAPEGPRRVLVVGAGPGGMQAALDAHDRGHLVTLVDDADRLGGTLKICDTDSIKTELLAFRDYLIREVGRRDIEVRLGERVGAQFVREFAPEALVIAIGAAPISPPIPGVDAAITGLQTYFVDPATIGEHVVILGGGLVGSETGLEWAAHGRDVTVVEQRPRLVPESLGIHRTALLDEMTRHGVKSLVNTTALEVRPDGVLVEGPDGQQTLLPADTVVVGLGSRARSAQAQELQEAAGDIPVFVIGDARSAARVGEAVIGGYRAAMAIV
ncbi:MAG: FAD-dependent oxidoreductase [Dermatophilaceae bacterium]